MLQPPTTASIPSPCHSLLYHNTLQIENNHFFAMGLLLGIVCCTQHFNRVENTLGTSPHERHGSHVFSTFFNNSQHGSGRVENTWARPHTNTHESQGLSTFVDCLPMTSGWSCGPSGGPTSLCPWASLQPRFSVVHLDPISCPSPSTPSRPTHN